ncbi:hypothetical protein AOLI_G00160350 [Acnodon oligacanthus]
MSSSGWADTPSVENQGLLVLQLNVEGLTIAKLKVIRHLADFNNVAVVLLQKTHWVYDDNLKLPGFLLTGSIHSKKHGMATFVRERLSWSATSQSPPGCNIEWLVTKIQETSVVNVYKAPLTALTIASLPSVPAPAIYAGDFNCQHTDWGYNHTSHDGVALSECASNSKALLLFDPKEPPSFFSARWNSYTNPDLAFAICRSNDLKPERRVLDSFPHSHHQPSIIKVPSLVQPVAGKPVRRWNFRKANWQSFMAEMQRKSAGLLDPEVAEVHVAYVAYCKVILRAAKHNILHGYNKNYILGWDEECSCLLRQHQQASSREEMEATATTLLQKLDDTQRTRWTEDIEDSFQDNEKAGVVFLDLTATYDTVWHRGLHLKLLRTILDRHMVRFIREMLVNHSFIVHTSDGQTSRLRILKYGVSQGSVLSPMLFNIYIYDLPDKTATKYGYMDDLAIML